MSDNPELADCRWCGEAHGPRCPWVKALQFSDTNGLVTRVEFLTPADCGIKRAEHADQAMQEPADYPKLKPMGG